MKLVEGAKNAWKWHSVQVFAALTVLPIVWMELPADIKAKIPAEWMPFVVSLVAFGGLIGRLRSQPK